MTPTLLTLANTALTALGEGRIAALAPVDESERAQLVTQRLFDVVDAVLEDHPWNCAMTRVSLPAMAEAPAFDWDFQYVLPTDPWCLRVWRVGTEGNWRSHRWTVEGRRLLTDYSPPAPLLYIRRVVNVAEMSAHVREAIAARLAAELAMKISESGTKAEQMQRLYEKKMAAARAVDGQESGRRLVAVDSYLRDRLTWGGI
jgi:hypothetical protein